MIEIKKKSLKLLSLTVTDLLHGFEELLSRDFREGKNQLLQNPHFHCLNSGVCKHSLCQGTPYVETVKIAPLIRGALKR